MIFLKYGFYFIFCFSAIVSAQEKKNSRLDINILGNSYTYDSNALLKLDQNKVTVDEDGRLDVYSGPTLASILKKSGYPIGQLKGKDMKNYLVVSGMDGFSVVISLAEIDPSFTDQKIIVALFKNGSVLDQLEGPFRLIVLDKGIKARRIKQVTSANLNTI